MEREDWNERWRERERHFTDLPNPALQELVAGLAPARALDAACGAGRNAVWLAGEGWQVTGVDFSDVALAQARERAAAHGVAVSWVEADVHAYEPPSGAFDLVYLGFLQIGADGVAAVLRRLAGGLAADGLLLAVGHDRANHGSGAPGPRDPAKLWEAPAVAAALTAAGLAVERAGSVPRATEKDGQPATAIDTVVVARRPA